MSNVMSGEESMSGVIKAWKVSLARFINLNNMLLNLIGLRSRHSAYLNIIPKRYKMTYGK